MSEDVTKAVERQRRLLYERKSDAQLVLTTLHLILEAMGVSAPALKMELARRYSEPVKDEGGERR